MEWAEWNDTISLRRLEKAAMAMSCRLVVAIVPFQSNFEGQGIEWAKQKLWRRKAAPRRKKKVGRRPGASQQVSESASQPRQVSKVLEAVRLKTTAVV
jgi:hypothetical protein